MGCAEPLGTCTQQQEPPDTLLPAPPPLPPGSWRRLRAPASHACLAAVQVLQELRETLASVKAERDSAQKELQGAQSQVGRGGSLQLGAGRPQARWAHASLHACCGVAWPGLPGHPEC